MVVGRRGTRGIVMVVPGVIISMNNSVSRNLSCQYIFFIYGEATLNMDVWWPPSINCNNISYLLLHTIHSCTTSHFSITQIKIHNSSKIIITIIMPPYSKCKCKQQQWCNSKCMRWISKITSMTTTTIIIWWPTNSISHTSHGCPLLPRDLLHLLLLLTNTINICIISNIHLQCPCQITTTIAMAII